MSKYKDAQYCEDVETKDKISIKVKINGSELYSFVPFDPNNADYAEILKQVEAGTLTIKDAD